MGDCQNYGPFLGTLNIRCRFFLIGIQKGTIILKATHIFFGNFAAPQRRQIHFTFSESSISESYILTSGDAPCGNGTTPVSSSSHTDSPPLTVPGCVTGF